MTLSHPFDQAPAFGETVPVAPGVLWLRMPLPFALDHVNLWLIEDGEGWALVDTGIGDDRTRALWEQVFAGPMGGRKLTRLIATHYHPDHMGLAAWLGRRFGVPLETPREEWLTGRTIWLDVGEEAGERAARFYRAAGTSEDFAAEVAKRVHHYRNIVDGIPSSFKALEEGQDIKIGGRNWRVMIGRGHSPSMACLVCDELGLLISGDQILPTITPNVSILAIEPDDDPLARFLSSLESFKALPADTLVLPSHRTPFRGLHERIDALRHHHEERLEAALEAARDSVAASDMLGVLFARKLDNHQIFFALGETLAHLNHLIGRGLMTRERGPDGVNRYRRL
ncbi:MAG: MBL fold metallo-hydrolase [Rhodospirillaceae bacterium]|nr:MBL fold metallo-hydrolase [Rhodospirillaceae bacterium]